MNHAKPLRSLTLIADLIKSTSEITGEACDMSLQSRVEALVKRRYQDLGFHTLSEYGSYFENHEKAELKHVLTHLTTEPAGFFRGLSHLEFISESILPNLVSLIKKRPDRTLRVWSADCMQGQEAISIALYLKHSLKSYDQDLKISILGTDPELELIAIAKAGFYPRSEIREIPLPYMGDTWQRSTQAHVEGMLLKAPFREALRFQVLALTDLSGKLADEKFDLIFCRTAFSSWNESQIKETAGELLKHLNPSGSLFVGVSESLDGLGLPLELSAAGIYRFKQAKSENTAELKVHPLDLLETPLITRVFCIEDAPAVLTLLKQVLRPELGFEIIGTATTGEDAALKIAVIRDADLVILHLNIRGDEALTYLDQNLNESHPPILMLTSDSKNHAELLQKTFRKGEFEFIEKPVLSNLSAHGEAMRAKLKTLFLSRRNNVRQLKVFDQFKKSVQITQPEKKVRVLICGLSHLKKVSDYLRELQGVQPPIYIFFEGVESNLPFIARELKFLSGRACLPLESVKAKVIPGMIRVGDFKKEYSLIAGLHAGDRASISVFGEVGLQSSQTILGWKQAQLILEDLGIGHGTSHLNLHSSEVFPTSSFAYLSSEFLEKK